MGALMGEPAARLNHRRPQLSAGRSQAAAYRSVVVVRIASTMPGSQALPSRSLKVLV